HERGELSRHATGQCDRPSTVLQRCHAFFEHGDGRITDPRVDIAVQLEIEKLSRFVGVLEYVGRGLVDRHSTSPNVRIRNMTRVEHACIKSELVTLFRRHETLIPGRSPQRWATWYCSNVSSNEL